MGTRRRGDAREPSVRRRGRSYEQNLRALGDQIDGRTRATNSARADRSPDPRGRGAEGGADGGRPRRRWSRKRKILAPLLALLVLAGIVAGGGYAYIRYRYDQIKKVPVAAEHTVTVGAPFNMLVIGSDSRVGATQRTGVGTVTTVGGQRGDVLMVWHVVPATTQITIVSIPRDMLVQMVGKNRTAFGQFSKINASYNSGPTLLVQTIQDNFGIQINHVIQVNFAGFKGAVNALGGVHMDFPYPARDAYSGLDVTTTGCRLLNGTEALAVARSRHYQYEKTGAWIATPLGDLARIRRQDSFLKALVDAAKSKYNPLQLNAFLGSLPQGLVVDKTFSLGEMTSLAEHFHSITPNTIKSYTLPTLTGGNVPGYGDSLFANQPADQQLLVSVFGNTLEVPSTPPPNETMQPTPPPTTVTPSTTTTATGATSPKNAYSSSELDTTPPFDPVPCSP